MQQQINNFAMNYSNAIPLPMDPFYSLEYNDQRRLKAINLSHTLSNFERFKNLPYNNQIDIVMRIENSCSNEAIRKAREYDQRCTWDNDQFISIYHSICYNILSVLDQENNTLIEKILNNKIDLNIIATMPCKDLSPEKYDDITKEINRRVNTEVTRKYTEMYYCKKCKRNQTTYERVQNRSGDEGSSFHILCLFCGTNWFK